MYIDADFIIKAASLLSALGALVAAVVAVYKVLENNRKQNEFINAMQEEQTLICYGLRGALQGLVEQGCNGPCKGRTGEVGQAPEQKRPPRISRRAEMAGRRVNKKTKRKKKRIGTMDLILLLVFICLVIFTVTMIRLFQVYGSVPDTLVTCVFATLGGECGILGWIKTNKDKRQDRRWQREDMKREREAMEQAMQQTEEP